MKLNLKNNLISIQKEGKNKRYYESILFVNSGNI